MKRLALDLMLLATLSTGCTMNRVGPAQSVTRCPVCGWPVELMGSEMQYVGATKEIITWYQCTGWACGYQVVVTNRYERVPP